MTLSLGAMVALWVGLTLTLARVTRLVTDDHWPPSAMFRQYVKERTGVTSGWYTFITCPWCVSVWFAIPLYVWAWHLLAYPLIAYVASTYVAGALGSRYAD